jgi:hypothetical protein
MRRSLAAVLFVLGSLVAVDVGPAMAATATTTTLAITPPSPALVGQQVTYTVNVTSATGAIPPGTVYVTGGSCAGQPLHIGPLDANGRAVFTAPISGPFTYNFLACYLPSNANFDPSQSVPQQYNVIQNATTTTLQISPPSPAFIGQQLTFTVTVTSASGATPVGTVYVTGANCSNPPVHVGPLDASGKAVFTAPASGPFTYNYVACYLPGTDRFAPSQSVPQQYNVIANATTTTLQISPPSPAIVGQQLTFTVTVTSASGAIPAGVVYITGDCSAVTNPVPLDASGKAVVTAPAVGPFTYSYRACYLPATDRFAPSSSQPQQYVVANKATPTISTQASPGGMVGTPVRDVATLSAGLSPTGTVTFRLFSDSACGAQVFTSTNAVAATTATSGWFTPAAPGTYYWTAAYSGDARNNAATSACNAPNESVVVSPFAPPAFTRTFTGDVVGPLTVNAGESVLITGARVVGPVTVNAGGSLSVVNSQITRGIVANNPRFLSLCGAQVSGPAPAQALGVSNATVPVRIGDPAAGCAGNRFAGQVVLNANLAVTFGANIVSHNVTVNNGGPGATVLKANTVFGTLACAGNSPAPVNAGQANTAAAKTGQCAAI